MTEITDPTGRKLVVDVVTPSRFGGWMMPVSYQLAYDGASSIRLPHGKFAIQVGCKDGAEVLVFLNGQKRVAQTVQSGVTLLEFDDQGIPFEFLENGEAPSGITGTDTHVDNTDEWMLFSEHASPSDDQPAINQQPVPDEPGTLFVVARFTEDNSPYSKPPRMEWSFTFALGTPEEHDTKLAHNFSRMEAPPDMVDPVNPLIGDAETGSAESAQSSAKVARTCLTCGQH